ncbi:MAG: glycosyltransferase family 4 protein [Rhodovibrio sp.]|nr:glycosyltransferase family 4 protein [Rhodovibrio sp.]
MYPRQRPRSRATPPVTPPAAPVRLLHVFPTFAVGGVQVRIADVAARLGGAYAHTLLALDGRTDALARTDPGNPWTVVDPAGLSGLKRLPAIRRALAAAPADLLCTYNFGAMDWALANRLGPRLAHLHFESGFGPDEAARPLRRRSLYRRLALAGVDRLVVPSHGLLEIAAAHRWAARSRVSHVVNGVDLVHYSPAAGVDPLPEAADDVPTIVAVAPLRAEKRLDRLIALFARAAADRPGRLLICGSGPCADDLRAQAAASGLGERIVFAGQIDDVRRALTPNSVFALTSVTEQMPNALLQAMAMARPVVAFEAGDVARILPASDPSQRFDQTDTDGFVGALSRLLGDAGVRGRLGRANRARAEAAYDMSAMVAAYDRLYRDALESRDL